VIEILYATVAVLILILAILADLLFGDPSPNSPWKFTYKLHPTVLMGELTAALEPRFKSSRPRIAKLKGVALALFVVSAFVLPVYFGLWAIYSLLGLLVYVLFAIILLKLTICIKLETDWAKAAAKAIESGNLVEARKYSHFSRRDSTDLSGVQMSSAVVESMAENLIDFKVSPILSYALFGVTGAIAFRAINTLDGMVGFKDINHVLIGWFSANLDTVVNYVPARLTAIFIVLASALVGEDYKNAWAIAMRDNGKTPSRNHGWPMAAMAGALRVQLDKPDNYILGEPLDSFSPDKILLAIRIRNVVIFLFVLICIPIILVTRFFFFPF